MAKITAHLLNNDVIFSSLPAKRDWMDKTDNGHAYRCLPVTLSNSMGWTISYPEEISFIWDGVSSSSSDHVKILKGHKYVHPNRANASISFNTGVALRSEENLSIAIMPVPNQFIDGAQAFTAIISTSVLKSEIPCAWMITSPNKVITIPKNTPIACIMPISLTYLQSHSIDIVDGWGKNEEDEVQFLSNYGKAAQEISLQGNWTNFYRDAVDHNGNTLGFHELKSIKLKTFDGREK